MAVPTHLSLGSEQLQAAARVVHCPQGTCPALSWSPGDYVGAAGTWWLCRVVLHCWPAAPLAPVRQPHLEAALHRSLPAAACQGTYCGLQIFSLINLIIERLADGVKPHCEGLLRLLPDLWQQGQTLLRVQVGRAVRLRGIPAAAVQASAVLMAEGGPSRAGALLLLQPVTYVSRAPRQEQAFLAVALQAAPVLAARRLVLQPWPRVCEQASSSICQRQERVQQQAQWGPGFGRCMLLAAEGCCLVCRSWSPFSVW